ncbi:MAG: cryptochrome/photolyase family protein [Acidobacteriota bacterium]
MTLQLPHADHQEGVFARALSANARELDETGRRWFFLPYDQLTLAVGPHAEGPARNVGLVLVETTWKPRLRPYHKQKLALLLANQRQFALEAQAAGYAVRYLVSHKSYASALRCAIDELGPLTVMEPAERELRANLAELAAERKLEVVAHEGWLTTPEQFVEWTGDEPPWRMDRFYRGVRRSTSLLMEDGKPEGGRFSFDGDNRKRWKGDPPAPELPRFEPDAVTLEVVELVETVFAHHPGEIDTHLLPATQQDAERQWNWALEHCMESFGPYEDAMSLQSSTLFHTRISPLLNLHRLLPQRVVQDVADRPEIPLSSREGFLRQIIGWREFVRHVHRETDGFRTLAAAGELLASPGDAGWNRLAGTDAEAAADVPPDGGGVAPQPFEGAIDLPPAFWGEPSGIACLDHVVDGVMKEAYSHHINRLMILSNLATLLDVDARQLTDWFWVAYADAYDWVVEPNVLGMGTYAVGDVMTTKPYVSGSAYIRRMGDYCKNCRFKKDCPITPLYWNYLDRHQERFQGNQRMSLVLRNVAKRSEEVKDRDRALRIWVQETLGRGEELLPENAPA